MGGIFKRQIPEHTLIFRKSKTSILGCGGLGTNLCFMLARPGAGRIKIVNYDVVEYPNLNRRIYRSTDVGKYRVDTFKEICDKFLPFANIPVENIKVTEGNIDESTNGYDIMLEASDDEYAKSLALEHSIGTDEKLISMSGIGDVKKLGMKIKKMNNIVVCGDSGTKIDIGLYYPNVVMAVGT